MLRRIRRNPLPFPLCEITKSQAQFPLFTLISIGAVASIQNNSSRFAIFLFSSSAAAASNLTKKSPIEEPILDFYRSYGFTDAQVRGFAYKVTSIRSIETVRPKLEHLLAFGFSPSELIRLICYDPNVLRSSLKERIGSNLNLLEATFVSKKHIIKAVIRGPWLITDNLEKHVIPNLNILRENNVPMDKVIQLFTTYPRVLYYKSDVIICTIGKLRGLGMSPATLAFIQALNLMVTLKEETLERKMELYRDFGWSEKDMLSAFSRHPSCVHFSEDKIKEKIKFFKEKLRWDSAMVLRWPVVLLLSLEKRVIPRCAILNVLANNGLWNAKPNVYGTLIMSEKKFKRRFVEKYEREVPEVIDAYQGKVNFVGFESMVGENDKS